ncbi:ATP-binding cassette domain-containing protein [Aurantibacter crassamenti]|uniref:ATP-binding cassette domain-containing protein n=1 Tax=Aurantibacter crassamenti TaxID=1837375 RepID=UPI00193AC15D|nr:ATP-binding cassette domain-containing protein [Aurantibacter crassamenti]MBM1106236.1 ATP-binding cassette domain-containing protein [Aurantibacter crassamenti]
MSKKEHWAIFIDNNSDKNNFIACILNNEPPKGFHILEQTEGALFSKLALAKLIDLEDRHGNKLVTSSTTQALKTMSSGEQKKALLAHILASKPDYIILDNPFDNLDVSSQADLKSTLTAISNTVSLVQIISRKADLLPFIETYFKLEAKDLLQLDTLQISNSDTTSISKSIPPPIHSIDYEAKTLIELKDVHVSYLDKQILKNINWKIQKGDFWELKGNNGTGKTTILSMITGENPKGYGQELFIFGTKKGSGESVWDIKKKIGYFTPSMTDKFTGYHSVENMIISGLNDSIGLYTKPTEVQLRTAKQWLELIDMWDLRNALFHDLSMGQKRLIMCARAMIKHPILLIFDEPTAGLDDKSASLFVRLVNKFSNESETAIIFVSHRTEPDLNPDFIYELTKTKNGSTGSKTKKVR